ncbi:MAG TPA: dihydroneopterin aldolase family protein [Thermoplasmata archaeon]|nr:dihydroneopterin aldolase family protein [Thermoplasmata archaeon]
MTRQAASGGPHRHHRASLSVKEALLFEAGIKLGGVFHQYLGTPVSSSTAPALARTIQDAVRLQPYVRDVRVRIDPGRGGPRGRGRFGYRYLTPEMLEVEVTLGEGRVEVRARLVHRPDLRYPLMTVDAAGEPPRPRRPRSAPRAGRRRGPSGRRTAPSGG